MSKKICFILSIALSIIILDQWTKYLVVQHLGLHDAITIIPNCFHIVHVRNPGAAFGIFAQWEHGRAFLTAVSAVASLGVFGYFLTLKENDHFTRLALAMIFGGAVGNLIDRMRFGFVVDFIDWHFKDVYHWPAFNVADSSITVAIGVLLVGSFFVPKAAEG